MSVIAKEMKFRVSLDVSGARADLSRTATETERSEGLVRRRQKTQTGEEEGGFFAKYFNLGSGGLGVNAPALFSKQNLATASKVGLAAAAVAGTAYAIDYAAEHGIPNLYARAAGTMYGTKGEGLAAASMEDAERGAKTTARHRAEITQYLPSIGKADDHFENVALLGGKPPTWSRKAYVEKEQYEMLKYKDQMDSLRERMREQITKRFWGRYTTGILGDAIKNVTSMW